MSEIRQCDSGVTLQNETEHLMTPKDEKECLKLPIWLKALVTLSILIAIAALYLYTDKFGSELSSNQEMWGQFGDYIGGTLNPLFAFTALLALLYTIKLQSKELRNSAKQLKKSAIALESQNSVLEKQNFEATFFQLLRLYNDIVKELHINETVRTTAVETGTGLGIGLKSKTVKHEDRQCIEALHNKLINNHLNKVARGDILKPNQEAINEAYQEFYSEFGNLIGHYFRIIYNIIKFVDNSHIKPEQKNTYTNLLRAQLSKHELGLLLYNCLSKYGSEKMLPLVAKYKILKHIEADVMLSPDDLDMIDKH